MKFVIFACLLALAVARPDKLEDVPQILRSEAITNEDGSYSFKFETSDGISRSESGSRLDDVENKPVGSQGFVRFTFPSGEEFELTFVADENGYQPQSSWLPVAPAFPHPIPQFVLDQIAKAAREDAEAAALTAAESTAVEEQAVGESEVFVEESAVAESEAVEEQAVGESEVFVELSGAKGESEAVEEQAVAESEVFAELPAEAASEAEVV